MDAPKNKLELPLPAVVLLLAGLATAGLLMEVDLVNGPAYWKWPWRTLGFWRTALRMAPAFALVGWVIWRPKASWGSLAALVLANGLLQGTAMTAQSGSLHRVAEIVVSPMATNYYTEALKIESLGSWLAEFHRMRLGVHSGTHPPGPILYYYGLIHLVGPDAAPLTGGLLLGALGSLGVVVLYWFAGPWVSDERERMTACTMYALIPALVLFLPQFDQVYPIVAMVLLRTWMDGVRGRVVPACVCGAMLFVSTMFAYGLLTLGAFMALYSSYSLGRAGGGREAWIRLSRSAIACLGVFGLLHIALALASGYDAVGSFENARAHQARIDEFYIIPYPAMLVFAPYDFFLGGGVAALPLLLIHARKLAGSWREGGEKDALVWIGIATILIIDLAALLPSETARLWLFLQPLAVLPASILLSRWSFPARLAVFLAQGVLLVAIACKLSYICI